MQKAIKYEEGFTTEGLAQALAVNCVSPFQGKLQSVIIHLADPVNHAGDIIVRHNHSNALNEWKTELFREDPNDCADAYNIVITTPVSMKVGDWISVDYANPSDIVCTAQITLEVT